MIVLSLEKTEDLNYEVLLYTSNFLNPLLETQEYSLSLFGYFSSCHFANTSCRSNAYQT